MERAELSRELGELVTLQEGAIDQHPPKTGAVYKQGRAAFLPAQRTTLLEMENASAITESDLTLASQYVLSSSFISAWYHLLGDKQRRDQAAHSCCTVISGLGLPPEQLMLRYLDSERRWRALMKQEGIAPGAVRRLLKWIVLVIVAAVILRSCFS